MTSNPWHCPDHPTGPVSQAGDRFRCEVCGQTNHPLDLPGVDRVLVVAGDFREYSDWLMGQNPDRIRRLSGDADIGSTQYRHADDRRPLRGHNPVRTRHLLVGRYWLKPELVEQVIMFYPAAELPTQSAPEPRQAPEPVNWPVFHSPDEPLPGSYIGNPACRFNARSRFLRCAVRPEAGSCEGCSDFEGRE